MLPFHAVTVALIKDKKNTLCFSSYYIKPLHTVLLGNGNKSPPPGLEFFQKVDLSQALYPPPDWKIFYGRFDSTNLCPPGNGKVGFSEKKIVADLT